jgi:hypothetical protein
MTNFCSLANWSRMHQANKLLLISAMATLTACGGGGGSDTTVLPPAESVITSTYHVIGSIEHENAAQLSFALARLDRTDNQYVVAAGLLYSHNPPANYAAPVRIFRIGIDGSGEDATQKILGETPTAATAKPLIADFNNDGIDDIFLAGMLDHSGTAAGVAWISRPGQTHRKLVLPTQVWTHDAVAVDIDHDGDTDVVNSHGQMWINDGSGNFSFRDHHWNINFGTGHWMHGSGVCAGDFNRTGRTQLVITDLSQDGNIGPKADTVIYELGTDLQPVREHVLPMPILDRNTTKEISHEVTCLVADVNNDAWPDILVFGRPLPEKGSNWTNQGNVQILLNRGGWQFEDATAQWLPNYNTNHAIAYMPMALDLNNDGRVDFWFTSFSNHIESQMSVWINRNTGLAGVFKDVIADTRASGGMIPLRTSTGWRMVYAKMNAKSMTFYTSKSLYQIN